MGCYYELSGSFDVRDTPETRAILKHFKDEQYESGGIKSDITKYGIFHVSVNIAENMPYSRAVQLDEDIQELGRFMDIGVILEGDCDGDSCTVYVGPGGDEAKAVSHYNLEKMIPRLDLLTREDVEKLTDILQQNLKARL